MCYAESQEGSLVDDKTVLEIVGRTDLTPAQRLVALVDELGQWSPMDVVRITGLTPSTVYLARKIIGQPGRGDVRHPKACSEDGCEGRAVARGLCQKHYKKWQRSRKNSGSAATSPAGAGIDIYHVHMKEVKGSNIVTQVDPQELEVVSNHHVDPDNSHADDKLTVISQVEVISPEYSHEHDDRTSPSLEDRKTNTPDTHEYSRVHDKNTLPPLEGNLTDMHISPPLMQPGLQQVQGGGRVAHSAGDVAADDSRRVLGMLDELEKKGLPLEQRDETLAALGIKRETDEEKRRIDRIWELWQSRIGVPDGLRETYLISEVARLKHMYSAPELDRETNAWSRGIIQRFEDVPEDTAHRLRLFLEGRGDSANLIRPGTYHHHDLLWHDPVHPIHLADYSGLEKDVCGGYWPLEPVERFTLVDLVYYFEKSFDLEYTPFERRKIMGYFEKILLRDYHLDAVLHAIEKAADLYRDGFDEHRLTEPKELSKRFFDDATEEHTTFLHWGNEQLRWNLATKKEAMARFYGINPTRLPTLHELVQYLEARWITLTASHINPNQFQMTCETLSQSSAGQAYLAVIKAAEWLRALPEAKRNGIGIEVEFHARIRSEARRITA